MKTLILIFLFTISLIAQPSELIMLFSGGLPPNTILNAGAPNTTDWVDTNEDGLADNMALSGTPTVSIVDEGNRYQKLLRAGSSNNFNGVSLENGLDGIVTPLQPSNSYTIIIKYRSNGAKLRIGASAGEVGFHAMDVITGTATFTFDTSTITAPRKILITFNNEADNSKYCEIDFVHAYIK